MSFTAEFELTACTGHTLVELLPYNLDQEIIVTRLNQFFTDAGARLRIYGSGLDGAFVSNSGQSNAAPGDQLRIPVGRGCNLLADMVGAGTVYGVLEYYLVRQREGREWNTREVGNSALGDLLVDDTGQNITDEHGNPIAVPV